MADRARQPQQGGVLAAYSSSLLRQPGLLAAIPASTAPLALASALSLDKLHIALLQILLLFLVNLFSKAFSPVNVEAPPRAIPPKPIVLEEPVPIPIAAQPHADSDQESSSVKHPAPVSQRIEHPVYTDSFLDGVLHRFLTFADPASLSVFPSVEGALPLSDAIPVAEWVRLFENDILTVSSHPTLNGLYSITTIFPTLSLRSLWELMLSIESRTDWDNSCEQTQHLENIGPLCSNDGLVQDRQASISYLALKSMFPIKPRDMVLLSVLARLAPSPNTTGKPRERLVSATTSVQHDSKPAQSGYQRMTISNSGFLAEELPEGGCRLMQISDLSGLGTWIPQKILNTITQKVLPKSLIELGRAAETMPYPADRLKLSGDNWFPPLLSDMYAARPAPAEDVQHDEGQKRTAAEERAVGALEQKLRVANTRLTQLERENVSPSSTGSSAALLAPSSRGWFSWLWGRSSGVKVKTASDPGLLLRTTFASAIGGATGAAAVIAFALVWARRVKRA